MPRIQNFKFIINFCLGRVNFSKYFALNTFENFYLQCFYRYYQCFQILSLLISRVQGTKITVIKIVIIKLAQS